MQTRLSYDLLAFAVGIQILVGNVHVPGNCAHADGLEGCIFNFLGSPMLFTSSSRLSAVLTPSVFVVVA